MKIQTLFDITLSTFAEVTETFSFDEYPLTAAKCLFAKNFFENLGYKGFLKLPFVSGFTEMAGGIGIYDAKTEEVNLELLFMGLDGTLKKCEKLPIAGITFTKKDLELWAKRVKEAGKKSSKKEGSEDED